MGDGRSTRELGDSSITHPSKLTWQELEEPWESSTYPAGSVHSRENENRRATRSFEYVVSRCLTLRKRGVLNPITSASLDSNPINSVIERIKGPCRRSIGFHGTLLSSCGSPAITENVAGTDIDAVRPTSALPCRPISRRAQNLVIVKD